MSTGLATPAPPAGSASAPRGPGFLRRNRTALLIGLAVVLVLVGVSWLNRNQAGTGGDLDPANPKPAGARAVAQVLGQHGVPVDIVRGRSAFDHATLDPATTVVVSDPDSLGKSTWNDLDARVRASGATLVVIGLSPAVLDGLSIPDADVSAGPDARVVPADCALAVDLFLGLSLTSDYPAPALPGAGCFGTGDGRLLVVDQEMRRWVLTAAHPVSNEEIDKGDNAAIVLRLLGQRDRVVWYVARVEDTAASDGIGVSRLLPRWLIPSLWMLGLAVLALLLVRARRLGPLVVEPIPVAIKALESTTALGRMYEKARDRGHAADLLVQGTIRRLHTSVGLAAGAGREDVVRAIAARTGRPLPAVAALLADRAGLSGTIRSDADLVTLAQNLHQLEEEVQNR